MNPPIVALECGQWLPSGVRETIGIHMENEPKPVFVAGSACETMGMEFFLQDDRLLVSGSGIRVHAHDRGRGRGRGHVRDSRLPDSLP